MNFTKKTLGTCLALLLISACGQKKEESSVVSLDATVNGLAQIDSLAIMAGPEVGQSISYEMVNKEKRSECNYQKKRIQKTLLANTNSLLYIKKVESLINAQPDSSTLDCADKVISTKVETKSLSEILDIKSFVTNYVKGFEKNSREGSCNVNVELRQDSVEVKTSGNCGHKAQELQVEPMLNDQIVFNTKYHWLEPVLSRNSSGKLWFFDQALYLNPENTQRNEVSQTRKVIQNLNEEFIQNLVHQNAEYVRTTPPDLRNLSKFDTLKFSEKEGRLLLKEENYPNVSNLGYGLRDCKLNFETEIIAVVKEENQNSIEILLTDKVYLLEDQMNEYFVKYCKDQVNYNYGKSGKIYEDILVLTDVNPGVSLIGKFGSEESIEYRYDDGSFDDPGSINIQ